MLVGCAVGGIVEGIGGGVQINTFVFTSLLTIPVFDPMLLYAIAVAAAFATSFFLIVTFGYRTKEDRAKALAAAGGTVEADPAETSADLALEDSSAPDASVRERRPAQAAPPTMPVRTTRATSPNPHWRPAPSPRSSHP